MNKIIEKIAKLRDERGWTNYRLSLESGVSTATIISWYKTNATPKLNAIQQLCDCFGITLAEFFNFENECINLSQEQKEILTEYDLLNKNEKLALINLIKTMNITRKSF